MINSENATNTLEFAQVCWVVPDIHATVKHLSSTLGITFPKVERSRAQDVNMTYYGKIVPSECLTTQAYYGTYIELVQPTSGKSMFTDYLEKYPQGGVQHQAFRLPVDGFERITKNFHDQGYELISVCDHPLARMAFFDTYKTMGFVTEIMGLTPEGWKVFEPMERAYKK